MIPEILHPKPEQSPFNTYTKQQNALIERLHSFQEGRSGDTYFGTMKIYREPQVVELRMQNGDSTIILDQTRCETNDLGVNSRVTLIHEEITEDGKAKTIYRCGNSKAVRGYINGHEPTIEDMTDADFEKASNLLSAINLAVKLL